MKGGEGRAVRVVSAGLREHAEGLIMENGWGTASSTPA